MIFHGIGLIYVHIFVGTNTLALFGPATCPFLGSGVIHIHEKDPFGIKLTPDSIPTFIKTIRSLLFNSNYTITEISISLTF